MDDEVVVTAEDVERARVRIEELREELLAGIRTFGDPERADVEERAEGAR